MPLVVGVALASVAAVPRADTLAVAFESSGAPVVGKSIDAPVGESIGAAGYSDVESAPSALEEG